MDLGLTDKSVLVSGGASGIGEGIVRAFAGEGAKVAFIDVDVERSNALVDELTEAGGTVVFLEADLTDEDACNAAVWHGIKLHGAIYCLVNCAGLNDGVGLTGNLSDFRRSLERNLVHYFTLASACRESLIKTQGAIVNISSKTGTTGQGGNSGYAASKGGINSFTRDWALELAPLGVRVNSVIPAEVVTPQYDDWLDSLEDAEETLRKITSLIPLGNRRTECSEVADMVLFLASERSSHTTGQHIFVDGGYTHLDKANIDRRE